MARRSAPPLTPQAAALTPQAMRVGIERLRKRIEEVKQFDPQAVTDQYNIPEMEKLQAAIDDTLVRTFGAGTPAYKRCASAAVFDNGPHNYAYAVPIEEVRNSLIRSKARSVALLEQTVQSLEEQIGEVDAAASASLIGASLTPTRKVFVVHGHDEGQREAVARFLERIGFEPVILHERPNKGRTIITKFREEAADIGFAVVLMTPDDHGSAVPLVVGRSHLRARQNVIFELGFFIGKLGPDRVAALVKGDIERPSDFDGVVYISLDDKDWPRTLGRELEAAGYEIDWNKVMRS